MSVSDIYSRRFDSCYISKIPPQQASGINTSSFSSVQFQAVLTFVLLQAVLTFVLLQAVLTFVLLQAVLAFVLLQAVLTFVLRLF